MEKQIEHFLMALRRKLETCDCVRTPLGDFIARKEQRILGRNPRTKEEIRLPGKYFYYLLAGNSFIAQVFNLKEPELSEVVKANQEMTLHRMEQRFGVAPISNAPPSMEVTEELVQEITTLLKTTGKIELKLPRDLFDGQLKVDKKTQPVIIFSAVGRLP